MRTVGGDLPGLRVKENRPLLRERGRFSESSSILRCCWWCWCCPAWEESSYGAGDGDVCDDAGDVYGGSDLCRRRQAFAWSSASGHPPSPREGPGTRGPPSSPGIPETFSSNHLQRSDYPIPLKPDRLHIVSLDFVWVSLLLSW